MVYFTQKSMAVIPLLSYFYLKEQGVLTNVLWII